VQVCRSWKHVDDHTRASLTLSLSHWHKEVAPSAALARLLQRFQNLTSLNLWYIDLSPDFLNVSFVSIPPLHAHSEAQG
jgi:hypothetical protein